MEKICVYVEDNPDALLLMPLLFPLAGMSLLCFKDSQNFMMRLNALASRPSLFMLDIHVPPLDGFELLKLLRAEPEYSAVPVIALTASVMNEEVQQLRQAGFNGVLAKPVDMQVFPSFVERILAGERLWRIE
jgi:CheY-like chemotaxis protein